MKAYLSGAIEHAPDHGKMWRLEMQKWLENTLGHSVYNPNTEEDKIVTKEEAEKFRMWRNTDYPRFKEIVRRFIRRDIHVIRNNIDYIVCLWDEYVLYGGGTHGELTMAHYCNIPVYTVVTIPKKNVSAWILGCSSEEFTSFNELKQFLKGIYGNN